MRGQNRSKANRSYDQNDEASMTPRRISRRPSPTPPLEPAAFVRRLAAEVGADRGKRLVKRAIAIVEATGRPNRWIFEVRRARERGSISPAVARFLIFKFAESAMTRFPAGTRKCVFRVPHCSLMFWQSVRRIENTSTGTVE